jgi:hypothetical protein
MNTLAWLFIGSTVLNLVIILLIPLNSTYFAKKGYEKGYSDGFEDGDEWRQHEQKNKNGKTWN